MRGLRRRPGRGARGRRRRPGAAPGRGAGPGRGERQRQVHPRLRRDPAAPGPRDDHRRQRGLLPGAGRRGGPARRQRGHAAGAALVPDLGRDAERHERAEPGAVHRVPAHRRTAGAPAGPGPGRAPGPGRRPAGDGRHRRRPARQLPARAVRRHAAAGDDRDGARPRAAGGHHGRADHRAGRGHPAGDPRGTHAAARAARLRGAVHHPRSVAARRDRGLDRGDVRRPAGRAGGRGRAVPGPPSPLQPRAAQLLPLLARAAAEADRHPRLTPDLRRLPAGCVFHPRCSYAMDRCRTDAPPLLSPGVPGDGGAGGGRDAACWLQDGSAAPPPELAVPAPPRPPAPAPPAPAPTGPAVSAPDLARSQP